MRSLWWRAMAMAAACSPAAAGPGSLPSHPVAVAERVTDGGRVVRAPGAAWVRLRFSDVSLPRGGWVCVTSLADGASQSLDAQAVARWGGTSAYFNGEAVLVEVVSPAGGGAGITVAEVEAGAPGGGARSICGASDDRSLADDPRVARLLPSLCTAFLIDDGRGGMLSAGHCGLWDVSVAQFNVPLSLPDGTIVHPPPSEQYAVDPASVQAAGEGGQTPGDDWAYLGCFANTETGLRPVEAQGAFVRLASAVPPSDGRAVRVSGHGLVSAFSVLPREWNYAQNTHEGPYLGRAGSIVQHAADTNNGTSGAAVLDLTTGEAIAIHTHGGCTVSGGANRATAVDHGGLRAALAAPRGVLAGACAADCTGDGVVSLADFVCFRNRYVAGDPAANCNGDLNPDGSVRLDLGDFLCFRAAFVAGCP